MRTSRQTMFALRMGTIALVVLLLLFAAGASAQTVVRLQPSGGLNDGTDDGSATKGKDTYASQGCGGGIPNSNHGSDNIAYAMTSTCNDCNEIGYLQFSTAGLPVSGIVSAKIGVYMTVLQNGNGWAWATNPTFGLRKVTSAWSENAVTWGAQPSYADSAISSQTVTGVAGLLNVTVPGWVVFDVTDLYKNWVSGGTANNGVRLSHDNGFCLNGTVAYFNTSDLDATTRPYLEVSYGTAATGAPAMTPAALAALAILLGCLAAYALKKPHGVTGGN